MLSVCYTVARHALKSFGFDEINIAARPFYANHVIYACALGIYWNSYNQSSIVFAFGGYIGFIYLMNLDTNSEIQTEILKGCYGNIMCLKFLKSVKNRMLSSAKDCSLCLWDITKREIMYKFVDQSCLLSFPKCFVI